MDTPVALFAFNRASTTRSVFAAIRAAQPRTLLLICDGPRSHAPTECDAVRQILSEVDWPCDVRRNYAPQNMGCRARMVSGLTWVFSAVAEAILLEDDCLPDPSFFTFAAEMLARYRDDARVMMISGFNPLCDLLPLPHSYTTARSTGIWGWASWARAWTAFDDQILDWPRRRETNWLQETLQDEEQVDFWKLKLDRVFAGETTWDWQWTFAVWTRDGLAIVPSHNLIVNIGFEGGGTSAATVEIPWVHALVAVPSSPLPFPLDHPTEIAPDRAFDRLFFERAWLPQKPQPRQSRLARVWAMIKQGEFQTLVQRVAKKLRS